MQRSWLVYICDGNSREVFLCKVLDLHALIEVVRVLCDDKVERSPVVTIRTVEE